MFLANACARAVMPSRSRKTPCGTNALACAGLADGAAGPLRRTGCAGQSAKGNMRRQIGLTRIGKGIDRLVTSHGLEGIAYAFCPTVVDKDGGATVGGNAAAKF